MWHDYTQSQCKDMIRCEFVQGNANSYEDAPTSILPDYTMDLTLNFPCQKGQSKVQFGGQPGLQNVECWETKLRMASCLAGCRAGVDSRLHRGVEV